MSKFLHAEFLCLYLCKINNRILKRTFLQVNALMESGKPKVTYTPGKEIACQSEVIPNRNSPSPSGLSTESSRHSADVPSTKTSHLSHLSAGNAAHD